MVGWWLLACGPTGDGSDLDPAVHVARPVMLEPGPYVPGTDVTWVVGDLAAGESAWVSWTFDGEGATGACPAELGGACFDLAGGVVLGPAVAEDTGTASVTARFGEPLDPLRDVWAQALVLRADGGVDDSPVIRRPMVDPHNVLDGDAVITGEADLAPLAGIASITGDLVVDGTGLAALSLPDLIQVGGSVRIWQDDDLRTLELPALRTVGGDLSLYDLPQLDALGGLSALESVGGSLSITRLPGLADLRGLERLTSIGADLYLFHDVGLRSLEGLDGLRAVGVAIDLWEDYALVDATLPALESVGKVDLFECDALVTVAFPALASLRAYELHECDAMTDLGDFPGVTILEGGLVAGWNDRLASTAGFPALASAGEVDLFYDPQLASLADLGSLATLTGSLGLRGLDALTAIDLPVLAAVDRLAVTYNPTLSDPGLPALSTVGTEAAFGGNPALSQCALEALFDRVSPPTVQCADNLDDGCGTWCLADAVP